MWQTYSISYPPKDKTKPITKVPQGYEISVPHNRDETHHVSSICICETAWNDLHEMRLTCNTNCVSVWHNT